ncbi:LysM peptidoglycan-binding domain-containing protein [Pelagibaculum spongiae]|nr:LysM peptidoglycan-binding domain-containing protein [Pelagibaculum spongiae]
MKRQCLAWAMGLMISASALAQSVALKPDHPDSYTVVKGDTLWDISALFLQDPWLWPEIWQANPQIENPHLIYPGDNVQLVYKDGQPRLLVDPPTSGGKEVSVDSQGRKVVKLKPQIRVRPIDSAIPSIPLEDIQPYLVGAVVMSDKEIANAAHLVAGREKNFYMSTSQKGYVKGLVDTDNRGYSIYRPGVEYKDPETGEVLGREMVYVAQATVVRGGDLVTVRINASKIEAKPGDIIVPALAQHIRPYYQPHTANADLNGRILSVYGGNKLIGQHNVIVLSKGENDGMEAGHVFALHQVGDTVKDPLTREKTKLPDEEAGVAMVFRTFDRVSLALVMKAERPMHVNDRFAKP